MNHRTITRLRSVSITLISVSALIAVSTMVSAGTPIAQSVRAAASTSSTPYYLLSTPGGKGYPITTSTNLKAGLSISATNSAYPSGQVAATIGLSRSGKAPESEQWRFVEAPAAFTVGSQGTASIHLTKAQIGNYGALNLTFTPASSVAAQCTSGGTGTIYSGKLTGKMRFYTNTFIPVAGKNKPVLGSFTVASPKFSIGTAKAPVTLQALESCTLPTPVAPCFAGISFWSPSYQVTGMTATGATHGSLSAKAWWSITVPQGVAGLTATITDQSPPQTFTSPAMSITTGAPGIATTGSATFTVSSPTPSHFSHSCSSGTSIKTQQIDDYSLPPTTWKNGNPPFAAHFSIGKTATESNRIDGYGSIDVSTFS